MLDDDGLPEEGGMPGDVDLERNALCAERARQAVEDHQHVAELADGIVGKFLPDPEANVIDLLTGLRHYCGRAGLDFDALADQSWDHYMAETFGECWWLRFPDLAPAGDDGPDNEPF